MAGIRLNGVSMTFGDSPVLRDVTLDIAAGEFIVILGKSGSGKSTLLRIIGGLERASSGDLQSTERLAIAFQEARLLPWFSVVENVRFGLKGADSKAVAMAALQEVRLTAKAQAWPLTLSGGEAQRVSLARALVRQPELLLLDEPLGALDALTRLEMQNLIGALWRTHGFTIVMVTHDVEEAIRLADRVVVLGDGVILDIVDIPGRGPRSPEPAVHAALSARLLRLLGLPLSLTQ